MAATSADVARRAGLSRATVSQVLNGHGHRFAPATERRVLEAAKELGYAPSLAGRMLRQGSSDFVIALVPNTTFGGNLQDVFDRVTDLLAEKGLTLVLRLSTQSASSLDKIVADMRPRAVISLQPFTDAERAVLTDRQIPCFDTTEGGDINYDIGRLQAKHLVDRGYRRLAFAHLRDARLDPYGASRERGVTDVCSEAGLPAPTIIGTGIDLADASASLNSLEVGSGVVCYNDDVAITLLNAAAQRGWKVPGDVGLIGMDNIPLARVVNPRLTTLGYDLAAVAQNNAAAVLTALGREDAPPFTTIDFRVIDGAST